MSYLFSAPSDPHQENAAPLFTHCTLILLSWQYMAGGDLGSALDRDIMENGPGEKRRLGWYKRGRVVLLCIARGLTYLHSERVRRATKLCKDGLPQDLTARGVLKLCATGQCMLDLAFHAIALWHEGRKTEHVIAFHVWVRSAAKCIVHVNLQASQVCNQRAVLRTPVVAAAGAPGPEESQCPAARQEQPGGQDRGPGRQQVPGRGQPA